MAKYVKRSIAVGSVVVSFLLGFPATDFAAKAIRRLWYIYGAYISMWLEQHASIFVALVLLCTVVLILYGVILFPSLSVNKKPKKKVDDPLPPMLHSLRDHFHIIRERVDFAQLLPRLYQDKILSYEEEIAKIQAESTRGLQTMCLIHMIERNGKGGVKGFIESLEKETFHLGHKDLAEELKHDYVELFPAPIKDNEGSDEDRKMEQSFDTNTAPVVSQTKRKPRLNLDSVAEIKYTPDSFGCHKKLIDWGLQIFPSQLFNNILYISVCMAGNFEFPSCYELVSPVYYFWTEDDVVDEVKIDMDHSVDAKTHKQSTVLSFVSADVSYGPPFTFSLIHGGLFNPKSSSGVISIKPQGFLTIMKRKLGRLTLRTDPQIKYEARVYYTWDTPNKYECTAHIVIIPAIRAWEKVVEQEFKDAIPGDMKEVSFVKSYISLVMPNEGLFVKGWNLVCTSQKSIHYDSVAKETSRLVIPECKISIKWVGEEKDEELLPVDLHCNIPFTGSHQRKCDSYFHIHSRSSQGKELMLL